MTLQQFKTDTTTATTQDETDLIAAAITTIPKEFVSTVTSLQERKGNALTLEDLEESMTTYWRLKCGNNDDDEDEPTDGREIILANAAVNQQMNQQQPQPNNQGFNGQGNNN